MHLELVVPALFPAQESAGKPVPVRPPALELLLARSRRSDVPTANFETWLCRAFGLHDGAAGNSYVPAGALTAYAHGLEPGERNWLRADPVHLRPDRDRVLLMPSQAFGLDSKEAQGLAEALAPLLAGKFALHAVQPDQWCLQAGDDDLRDISSTPPIDLAGADIDPHLPPREWLPLLTELQMSLYDHPVNTSREQRGEPVINSVWLWGAGVLPPGAHGPWQSLSAADPVAIGLARLAGMRHRPPGTGAEDWLGRAPEDGRHLVAIEGLRGAGLSADPEAFARRLRELEANWFAPLLAALRSGRIGMLTIHAPEAAASFEAARNDLHRFWRRPRALATYIQAPA